MFDNLKINTQPQLFYSNVDKLFLQLKYSSIY